uniref:Uncharacterized protein n=1 Tax=Engystomops pustulosus TaxID=76066 RepID=A0AAV6YQG6_ENGPU|nr:hypothetical protein GDO81_026773 [Engystomops pustulosus]
MFCPVGRARWLEFLVELWQHGHRARHQKWSLGIFECRADVMAPPALPAVLRGRSQSRHVENGPKQHRSTYYMLCEGMVQGFCSLYHFISSFVICFYQSENLRLKILIKNIHKIGPHYQIGGGPAQISERVRKECVTHLLSCLLLLLFL